MTKTILTITAAAACMLLTSCGGGSSSSGAPKQERAVVPVEAPRMEGGEGTKNDPPAGGTAPTPGNGG